MNFDGKVVLVTGGARGIGQAISEKFHALGAHVAVLGVNGQAATDFAAKLSAQGARCAGYACNVAQSQEVDATVEAVLKEFGQIDVLVNNAGITQDGLLMRMTDEAWNDVVNTNLTGAFRMLRACARPMIKARKGSVVNVSSVVALIGNAGQANYCSSKAGMLGLTKSAARELAARGIRVNAVTPGFIETAMTAKLTEDQRKELITQVPLKKMGTPAEVAAAVCFLASDEASYITGQVLSICGGMSM